jgi:hypothetical protein
MGRFFANQKLDEAGIVGITLQKLLIFFMVIDAAAFFFGFSLFSSFMSLLFHFVVFMGVYRRRTGVLLLYVIFHVAFFILAAFALILVVSSVMYINPGGEIHNNNSTSNITAGNSTIHPTAHSSYDLRSMLSYAYGSTPSNRTHVATPTPHAHLSSSSSDSSDEFQVDQSIFIISIIALLFSVVLLYCKILSVVLAHKMRKLLLAPPALPVSRPVESEKTQQSEPTFVPADFENNVSLFSQPGFAYQPMVPQNGYPGQSAMMPAPFMYGQHPDSSSCSFCS